MTRATEATAGTAVAAGCSSERYTLSARALRRSSRECSECSSLLHFRDAGNAALACGSRVARGLEYARAARGS